MKFELEDLTFHYGRHAALQGITCTLPARSVTAIVGPSGSGKSTLLGVFNRLWTDIPAARVGGRAVVHLDSGTFDLCSPRTPLQTLRRKVGMVFQMPNPLPMSVARNVAFPLHLVGHRDAAHIDHRVEQALRRVALWDEVKDRLRADARELSGGQQQRLCIARALMLEPEVLLFDEPTAALDSRNGSIIEALIHSLKSNCTLVLVSHDAQQVQRLADQVLQLDQGCRVQADPGPSRSAT